MVSTIMCVLLAQGLLISMAGAGRVVTNLEEQNELEESLNTVFTSEIQAADEAQDAAYEEADKASAKLDEVEAQAKTKETTREETDQHFKDVGTVSKLSSELDKLEETELRIKGERDAAIDEKLEAEQIAKVAGSIKQLTANTHLADLLAKIKAKPGEIAKEVSKFEIELTKVTSEKADISRILNTEKIKVDQYTQQLNEHYDLLKESDKAQDDSDKLGFLADAKRAAANEAEDLTAKVQESGIDWKDENNNQGEEKQQKPVLSRIFKDEIAVKTVDSEEIGAAQKELDALETTKTNKERELDEGLRQKNVELSKKSDAALKELHEATSAEHEVQRQLDRATRAFEEATSLAEEAKVVLSSVDQTESDEVKNLLRLLQENPGKLGKTKDALAAKLKEQQTLSLEALTRSVMAQKTGSEHRAVLAKEEDPLSVLDDEIFEQKNKVRDLEEPFMKDVEVRKEVEKIYQAVLDKRPVIITKND